MEQQRWTIRRILEWMAPFLERKGVDQPRLCAEMILSHVLRLQRIRLYTDLHRPLVESELAEIRLLVSRAAEHEPIQYLTGRAHFYGLEFEVTRDVLIPRPDTESLVERALAHLKLESIAGPRVLELCTGSGCVAAAIASQSRAATVVAIDLSLPALDVARRNVARLKLDDRVTLVCGDLFAPLEKLVDHRPFDLIVANPPYIATAKIDSLDRSVNAYEPRIALDGGEDGLAIHRRILADAPRYLLPRGALMLEIAFDQPEQAAWLVRQHPQFEDPQVFGDLAGNPRVVCTRLRG